MAGGKLSKREAAYRAKQAEDQKKPKLCGMRHRGKQKKEHFEGKPLEREEASDAYEFRVMGHYSLDPVPFFAMLPKSKSPEELDAYYEGQEELQALEEDD